MRMFGLPCLETKYHGEQRRISQEIDKQIRIAKSKRHCEIKILLLGTAEAGKTTFIRQMKIINGDGYSTEKRIKRISKVAKNIYTIVRCLIEAMDTLQIEYSNDKNKENAQVISEVQIYEVDNIDSSHVEVIQELWADTALQRCLTSSQCYIPCSTKYFLDSLERIADRDYIPTEQDILRLRAPTTGIKEHAFHLNKKLLRIIDVGGQRSERRKWIHCFEGVTTIIFLVSASEFDQSLNEDSTVNRLTESVSLFRTLFGGFFANTSRILFVNKQDLLEEKIRFINFKHYQPEFTGDENDVTDVREFITTLFVTSIERTDNMYSHYTTATDTENIERVFNDCQEAILDAHLSNTALL